MLKHIALMALRIIAAVLLISMVGLSGVVAQEGAGTPAPCPTSTPTLTPTFTITPTPSNTPAPDGTPVSLEGFVWDDWNQNGLQDAGEPGFAGIAVQLWDGDRSVVLEQTQTDETGTYTLTAYAPGLYRVRVILPGSGDRFSAPDATDDDPETIDDEIDSDISSFGEEFGFSAVIDLTDSSADATSASFAPDAAIILCGVAANAPRTATQAADTDSPSESAALPTDAQATAPDPTLTPTATASATSTLPPSPATETATDAPVPDTATPTLAVASATPTTVPASATATATSTPSASHTATQTPAPGITLSLSIDIDQIDVLIPDLPTATRTPTPINLGNFVWDDLDQDGRQDAGEPGLAGVIVQLWNSAKTQMLFQTTTNASGNYTVVAPLPGDYRVRVVLPSAGDQFSVKDAAGGDNSLDSDINPSGSNTGFTDVISIASNVISISNIDAGIILFRTPTPTRTPTPINVGNFVWDDLDQDGRQDAGEPGLAGVTVQLWNSTKTLMFSQTTTNASGNYTLVAPLPGNYRVRVVLPNAADMFSPMDMAGGDDQDDSDINPSGSDAGFTDVYVFASNLISITTIDAGIILFRTPTPTRTPTPINLGNFVWDDLDQDGRQDAGEPGLAGVTVQLWNSAKTELIAFAVTNASGNYTVVAPLPGDYRVRVVLPSAGDQFSVKDAAGGDNSLDSDINPSGTNTGFTDVISIASNVISITNIDAGIIRFRTPTPTRTPTPINLGNFVWDDLDEDGLHDLGEPGLEGVTVQLWNLAKTQMIDSTVTNPSGNYTLVAPLPGQYRIRVLLPNDTDEFSPKDAGSNDTVDSDINPSGIHFGFTDAIVIASNVISITNIDVGIIQTPILVAPVIPLPVPPGIQPLAGNVCDGFRLTSPLDGLPNGFATFYWDPAAVPMNYQVQILEGGSTLATFDGGTGTSTGGDVSQGAIGGGFSFVVRVVGILNGNQVCVSEATVLREAANVPPVQILPTPTPTRCPATRGCP